MKVRFFQTVSQHGSYQNGKGGSGDGDQESHTKCTDEQGCGEDVLIGLQCRLLREKDEGACHVLRITCQGDRNDVPEGEQDNDRQ